MKKRVSVLLLSIFIIVNSAFASVRNLTYNETFDPEINCLNLNLFTEDVTILSTISDYLSIDIYSNDKHKQPEVYVEDKTLYVSAPRNNIGFNYKCQVTVYIPKDYKFETIDIQMTSGDLDIDTLEAEEIRIQVTSGDVDANFIFTEYDTNIQTISGDIDIQKLYANTADIKSTSGDIEIGKLDCIFLFVKSVSGSQGFYDSLCDEFDITSTSGSIHFEPIDVPLSDSRIKTISGSVKLFIPFSSAFDLFFSTASGNFDDKRSHKRQSVKGEFQHSYNGGGVEIQVNTSSGSLTLEEWEFIS